MCQLYEMEHCWDKALACYDVGLASAARLSSSQPGTQRATGPVFGGVLWPPSDTTQKGPLAGDTLSQQLCGAARALQHLGSGQAALLLTQGANTSLNQASERSS